MTGPFMDTMQTYGLLIQIPIVVIHRQNRGTQEQNLDVEKTPLQIQMG